MRESTFRHFLAAVVVLVLLAAVVGMGDFKVQDPDFWWHIKTGEIMVRMRSFIRTDPYTYTLQSQPFRVQFEWLSEIILYGLYHAGGAPAIIVWRIVMMVLIAGLLLWVDPARVWPNGFVAIGAIHAASPGLVERPQLFSYAIFIAMLLMAFRYLEAVDRPERSRTLEKRILIGFVVLQMLWVNLHGACVLAYCILGALIVDRAAGLVKTGRWRSREIFVRLRFPVVLGGAVFLAFFVSPESYHNLLYLVRVMTDRSGPLISEWQPRPLAVYGKALGGFWILAAVSLALGRRGRVFSAVLLAGIGYLSFRSFRHEMFLVFSATAVCFFQLKQSLLWKRWIDGITAKKSTALILSAAGLLVVFLQVRASADFFARKGLQGMGVFVPARGAADFLEQENVQGPMFNTMDVGGYLAYRGAPGRRVYMDVRSWDYGFEFLRRSWLAGIDPAIWKSLEDQYQWTYAVIGYDSIREGDLVPYCVHLGRNPDWTLVYLDHWTAVYLKGTPENKIIIHRVGSRYIDPSAFSRLAVVSLPSGGEGRSPHDLNNRGISYARSGQFEQARTEFEAALKINPDDPVTLNNLAGTYVQEGQWSQALPYYRSALQKNPRYAEAHCNLARTLSRLGRCDDAVREAQVAGQLGSRTQELIQIIKGTCQEAKD